MNGYLSRPKKEVMDRGAVYIRTRKIRKSRIPPKPYNIQDSFIPAGAARPPAGGAGCLVYALRGRGVPAGHLIMPALRRTMRELSTDGILQELHAIAMARATDYMTVRSDSLEIRSTEELTPQQAAAIASIERSTGGLKLKFYDKLKALELLGKYLGLFDSHAAWQDSRETNLLQAILEATGQEVDVSDLPELQQAAAAGDDLVEQTQSG